MQRRRVRAQDQVQAGEEGAQDQRHGAAGGAQHHVLAAARPTTADRRRRCPTKANDDDKRANKQTNNRRYIMNEWPPRFVANSNFAGRALFRSVWLWPFNASSIISRLKSQEIWIENLVLDGRIVRVTQFSLREHNREWFPQSWGKKSTEYQIEIQASSYYGGHSTRKTPSNASQFKTVTASKASLQFPSKIQ